RARPDPGRMPHPQPLTRSLVVSCMLAAAVGGCVRVQRVDPGSAARPSPGALPEGPVAAWPERWGEERSGRKGVIVPEERPLDGLYGLFLGEAHRLRPGPREYRDAEALARGLGVTGGFR